MCWHWPPDSEGSIACRGRRQAGAADSLIADRRIAESGRGKGSFMDQRALANRNRPARRAVGGGIADAVDAAEIDRANTGRV